MGYACDGIVDCIYIGNIRRCHNIYRKSVDVYDGPLGTLLNMLNINYRCGVALPMDC
jgi:hypothetical protein